MSSNKTKYTQEFKQTIVNLYQAGNTYNGIHFEELKLSVFRYIHGFYNSFRPHSHNNGMTPNQAEMNFL